MSRYLIVAAALLAAGAPMAAQSSPAPASQSADFWQQMGDTTLARLTAESLRANRDVAMASARVRQARALRTNARLDLAPTVTVGGGVTRQRLSGASFGLEVPDRNLWDVGLTAAWELDLFGRLRGNLRGRNALVSSAAEDVRDLERIVTAELANAYYDLRGAQDRLDVANRNAGNQRRTLELTQTRLREGRGTGFDTERAQAQLSSTLATIPRQLSRAAAAGHRIGVLVGRDPQSILAELEHPCVVEPEQPCPPPELPGELVPGDTDSLIRARPDVRAAERRLAAGTAFTRAARADYLPRISLGGTAGYTATAFDSIGSNGTGRYAVGPMITWPGLNLGRVKAAADEARALEAEAQAQYEQTVLLAREELATARVAYAMARERLTQLELAAAASNRAAELARLRFTGGVADFLQVLDAERSLLTAQDQLAEGRTDAVTALVAVYRASGSGVRPAR